MLAYYNENDPFSAQWLRELIKEGAILNGEVDERDIREVIPADLAGFTQCHFFAGIGTWAYALRKADWKEEDPVWTGSCPCQPFSAAGQRKGFTDDRHLWPVFFELIRQCKPDVVFGEQVASKDGLDWIDLVSADLESEAYAIGTVDTCAAGFGAPHIRQRMYWVADSDSERWQRRPQRLHSGEHPVQATGRCNPCRLGDAVCKRLEGHSTAGATSERERERESRHDRQTGLYSNTSPEDTFWGSPDWLFCRDQKWRPTESGIFPLAYGTSARVGELRGYGNAIVAPQAQAFIEAYLECRKCTGK